MSQNKNLPAIYEAVKTLEQTTFRTAFGDQAEIQMKQELYYLRILLQNGKSTGNRIDLCTPDSVRNSVLQVVGLGLTLNPAMKETYLVSFGNTCTLIIGYQGMINYLHKNGVIQHADVGTVCEKDEWDWKKDHQGIKYLHKKPRTGSRGKIQGVYCIYHLPGGKTHGDYFTEEEVLKRKKVSKTDKFWGAWQNEMWQKTAVRMALYGLPRSKAVAELETVDNQLYDLSNQEVTEDRLKEIETGLKACKSKRQLDTVYMLFPKYERENHEVMKLYDYRAVEIEDLVLAK